MKYIKVSHRGRLANKMFQYMFSRYLQRKIENSFVVGYDIPEFSLICDNKTDLSKNSLIIKGHDIKVEKVIYAVNEIGIDIIDLRGYFQDVRYYDDRKFYYNLFSGSLPAAPGFGDDCILLNIRASEILENRHPDYCPLPFSYYRYLIKKTGLRPIFMGQINESNKYVNGLRKKFPEAEFHESEGPLHDFATIVNSKNIAISVSSFSWLAAFFSEAKNIFYPIAGFLNPEQRGDINLMPVGDERYRFVKFPEFKWNADLMVHEFPNESNNHFKIIDKSSCVQILRKSVLSRM